MYNSLQAASGLTSRLCRTAGKARAGSGREQQVSFPATEYTATSGMSERLPHLVQHQAAAGESAVSRP